MCIGEYDGEHVPNCIDRRRTGLLHTVRDHVSGDGPDCMWILISCKDDLCPLHVMCIYDRGVCTHGDGPGPPLYEHRQLLIPTAHRGSDLKHIWGSGDPTAPYWVYVEGPLLPFAPLAH